MWFSFLLTILGLSASINYEMDLWLRWLDESRPQLWTIIRKKQRMKRRKNSLSTAASLTMVISLHIHSFYIFTDLKIRNTLFFHLEMCTVEKRNKTEN